MVMCFGLGGVMTKSKSEEAFEKWCKENGKSERWDRDAWQAAAEAMLEYAKENHYLRAMNIQAIDLSVLETWVNGEVGE